MKRSISILGAALALLFPNVLQASPPADMVEVQGGTLPKSSSLGAVRVDSFSISRYEVTLGDWKAVRTWAATKGYEIGSAGEGTSDNHPVQMVSWCDAVKWCNARSEKEGLTPVYTLHGKGTTYKRVDNMTLDVNLKANGYRLPSDAEWEWAARGGVKSHGYKFSGSKKIGDVAWYKANSGGAAHPVGQKAANELGLYDMTGNIREWLWTNNGYVSSRGGCWGWDADGCSISDKPMIIYYPQAQDATIGFRPVRSSVE